MKKNCFRSNQVAHYILVLTMLFTCPEIFAQDSANTRKKWTYLLEPYVLFPNMDGKTGVGDLPEVEVDANPDDIFSNFQIGALLYFEAGNDRWAISSDIIYVSLEQDTRTGPVIQSGKVNAKQFLWEVAGLRRLLPMLEVGIGGRFSSIKAGVDIVQNNVGGGTTARSRSLSESWVDPILVARVKSKPEKKFVYQFRGDIGGFGIGADFAWQLQAYAGYRFSRLFQITAGYRILSEDYNKGSGQDRFLYDVDTFGPVIKFGFNF